MVDQCGNCAFGVQRTYGTKQVLECRINDPRTQGQLGVWAQVQPADWCGQYQPVGYQFTQRDIKGSQSLTATGTYLQLLSVAADAIYTAAALRAYQITNTNNQTVVVRFWDAATGGNLLCTVGVNANQALQGQFLPAIMAYTGLVYADLLAAASNPVYVSAQGTKERP